MSGDEIPVRVPVQYRRVKPPVSPLLIVILVALAFFAIVAAATMVESVGVGEVAVIVDPLSGSIVGTVKGPRLFFKAPWQYVVKISVAIESLDMWTDPRTGARGEWPAVTCLTKDGLEVHVDITVRWRVDPDRVVDLYKSYPDLRWETRTLAPLLRETVRDILSRYTAVETIEKRSEISEKIVNEFVEAVKEERSLAGAIIVEDVDVRNIALPEAFKKAIEQKLAEEQQKIAAQYRKERILIEANATATASILKARGEATARLIQANATAESIERILAAAGNNTRIGEIYMTYAMLRELVAQGGKVYILVVSGSGGGVQVVPVPVGVGRD